MSSPRVARTSSLAIGALPAVLLAAVVLASALLLAVPSTSAPALPRPLAHPPLEITSSPANSPSRLAPAAAFTLSVAGVTPAAISLSWTNPGSAFFRSYTLEESASSSTGPWTAVGQTTTDTTLSLAAAGLAPGGTYWWEVVDSYGLLTASTEDSNVVEQTQPAVAFLNSSGVTSTSATLSWTNNASYGGLVGFVSYTLYEAVGNGSAGPVVTLTSASTRSDLVSDLTSGTGYTFYLITDDCTAGCGTGTPTVSATQSNSAPVGVALPLAVTISARQSTVDVGELAYFTCTPSGGVYPYAFEWNFGNGTFVNGSSSVSQPFSAVGSPVVTCKVTDASSSSAEDATTVTVNSAPVLSAAENRTAADVGQPVGFTCSVTGGTAPVSLGWAFGDGVSFVGGVTSHTYATADQYVAVCSGMDGAGVPVLGSVSLTVSPVLDVNVSASLGLVAPFAPVYLNATATNGSGTYLYYNWSLGDVGTAHGASVLTEFTDAGTWHPYVVVTDSNGATVRAETTVVVSAIAVQLGAVPSSVVRGTSVSFTASASGGAGGPYNYTWNFGNATYGYGPLVAHVFGSDGSYPVNLTVRDAHGGVVEQFVGTVAVTAPPPPAPVLSGDFAWIVLLVGLLLALLVAALAYRYHRSREESSHGRVVGWVPPTGPSRTVSGMKVCGYCQAHNLPIRRTCSACGKPLPRAPSP